ncbi:hypothetical protein PILCRDRAFT_637 [Piloderma croceum F 1598]|uniref:Uncharacterized protein n=1 Tax=Piloderma croceum (strain F 1598) TaxID=765440 RepID=A0A0C3BY20_PILCF|nr:hypothetical protein PILCRDRAFT_637 [Piloderma croceum F 1598]
MKVSELDGYLFGCIVKPNIATDLLSHHHWVGNNNKLVGFLNMYVDNGELPSLQGPITQVHLIQEVLSISYFKDVTTWQATTNRMGDLCAQIYTQTVPTQDVMFMLAMLTALE